MPKGCNFTIALNSCERNNHSLTSFGSALVSHVFFLHWTRNRGSRQVSVDFSLSRASLVCVVLLNISDLYWSWSCCSVEDVCSEVAPLFHFLSLFARLFFCFPPLSLNQTWRSLCVVIVQSCVVNFKLWKWLLWKTERLHQPQQHVEQNLD